MAATVVSTVLTSRKTKRTSVVISATVDYRSVTLIAPFGRLFRIGIMGLAISLIAPSAGILTLGSADGQQMADLSDGELEALRERWALSEWDAATATMPTDHTGCRHCGKANSPRA